MREWDYLWEQVDRVFPGALPERVTLIWMDGVHSSFRIEAASIGIPSLMDSNIRRGKICRMLAHLALHRLSGGDGKTPGRCFDNDAVFLEQAVAGYMDREGAGLLESELGEINALAARLFRDGSLTLVALRDWEAFYHRGYWSDEYRNWNEEGLRALISLGGFLEERFGLAALGPVFDELGEGYSLNQAFQRVLEVDLDETLSAWRDSVLLAVEEPPAPAEALTAPESGEPEEAGASLEISSDPWEPAASGPNSESEETLPSSRDDTSSTERESPGS